MEISRSLTQTLLLLLPNSNDLLCNLHHYYYYITTRTSTYTCCIPHPIILYFALLYIHAKMGGRADRRSEAIMVWDARARA